MSNEDQDALSGYGVQLSDGPIKSAEQSREPTEVERRLRRELSRAREQARAAQNEREAAVSSIRDEADERVIRSEIRLQAMRSGIIDLDALRLLETSGLAVRTDGSVEGAEEAVAALKVSKPYLFGDGRPSGLLGSTGQARRPPSPARPETPDARTMPRDQWQLERARLLSRGR